MLTADMIKAGGALTLALFIPLLCLLSVRIKESRVNRRRATARDTDHFRQTRYFMTCESREPVSISRQTYFPIFVMLLFSLYFTWLLIYTPVLTATDYGNFLLLGHQYAGVAATTDPYLRQSFCVMCFAYLGWYIWTMSSIFSRLITMELVAATYYNVLVRLVVAVFVALVFNHVQSLIFTGGKTYLVEGVGFGVGLFPDSALVALTDVLRRYLLASDKAVEDFPLDLIQGVSAFRKVRLFEMGLDNCENLAAANAMDLFLTSNLKLAEVVDWIGQAQLLVLVGSVNFLMLQANGYRTSIDLHRGSGGEARPVLAGLLKYDEKQLSDLASGMEKDPSFVSLTELRNHLLDPPNRAPAPRTPGSM